MNAADSQSNTKPKALRYGELDRSVVVAAAVRLAERSGIRSVTVRALAIVGVVLIQVLGRIWPQYQLLLTGVGMLAVLMVAPGGLAEVGRRTRDRVASRLVTRPAARLSAASAAPTTNATAAAGVAAGRAPADALLACVGTEAAYGPVQILFGVDLDIYEGEIVALLGTNGAGKSTLFKCITGLLGRPRRHGDLRRRRACDGLPTDAIAAGGVVMMPGGQERVPDAHRRENLRLGLLAQAQGPGAVREAAERVLALFPGSRDRIDQQAGNLSGRRAADAGRWPGPHAPTRSCC